MWCLWNCFQRGRRENKSSSQVLGRTIEEEFEGGDQEYLDTKFIALAKGEKFLLNQYGVSMNAKGGGCWNN